MKNKTALIFGITGQDGSYLAELLLKKNYIVNGVKEDHQVLTHLELITFIKIPTIEIIGLSCIMEILQTHPQYQV